MPKDKPAEHDALKVLEARLKQAQSARGGDNSVAGTRDKPMPTANALSMAWRVSIEMVVAPLVCGFMGWWADRWLETKPWIFLTFLLLGILAGGLNAYRTLAALNREQMADGKNKIIDASPDASEMKD